MHWESQLKWSDNKDKYNFYGTSLLIFVFLKNSDLLTIHPQPVKFLKNEDGIILLLFTFCVTGLLVNLCFSFVKWR